MRGGGEVKVRGRRRTERVKDVAVCVTPWGYRVHTSLFVPKLYRDPSKADTKPPKTLRSFQAFAPQGGSAQWGQNLGSRGVCVLTSRGR